MKKIALTTLLIIIISCSKKVEVKSKEFNERYLEIVKKEMTKELIDLNGKYSIVSIQALPEVPRDSLDSYFALLKTDGYKFNFSKKESTVKLSSEFGMKFFGDTIFDYKIEDKFISLKNKNKNLEMPYINDAGIMRFILDKYGIKNITIYKTKK
ncbi:hypothetical protein [Polaribacter aestuariivivens]|uniref:hypothetical protein n=1 Tax=Polaribacter aestuariivivens TaxID=2304626 RepID=UPI003F49284D